MTRKFIFVVLLLLGAAKLFGAEVYSWDFESCELKDIIFMVSTDTGISISGDDTVSGKGSLKFSGTDFETAFDSFLEENRLYVRKTENRWIVSRFYMECKNELYSLDVCDLLPVQILEKLSLNLEEVVNYEQLPAVKLSMHFRNVTKEELLEGVAARLGSYEVKLLNHQITFFKTAEKQKLTSDDGFIKIENGENNLLTVDIKNGTFFEAIEALFEKSRQGSHTDSYCFLTHTDSKILRTSFCCENQTQVIEELCGQCGFKFIFKDGIYYFVKAEEAQSSLLYGNTEFKTYKTEYVAAEKVSQLITRRFINTEVFALTGKNTLVCKAPAEVQKQIEAFITQIDCPEKSYLIQLKYLNNEAFIEALPPEFERVCFHISSNNGPVYFSGTEEEYKALLSKIEEIDRPAVCIRYDLLILQYDESVQNNWSSSFNADRLSLGDRNNLGVQLGSLMNLNLNLVTSFGLNFAANVQTSIEENKTKVFADTVLYGVSGKTINFQNTSTYRYRDNNLDPETGKPVYSGVTREISSGIKLEVCGWVSGEGVITSLVTASVTRQGTDTSSSTGNPPPTTEKLVTTEVCGKSGEPIVLSGLLQNSTNETQTRTPLISRLPLLGNFFKSKTKTKEKSQMVIFLVPHISNEQSAGSDFLTRDWALRRIEGIKNL